MRRIYTYISVILLSFLLEACGGKGKGSLADIYPDYTDVTIPCNIAPLNFRIEGASRILVRVNAYSDDSFREIVSKYHIADRLAQRYLRFRDALERSNGNLKALEEYKDTYWYYIISTSIVDNTEQ